jgi:hypothetical protein
LDYCSESWVHDITVKKAYVGTIGPVRFVTREVAEAEYWRVKTMIRREVAKQTGSALERRLGLSPSLREAEGSFSTILPTSFGLPIALCNSNP